MAKGKRWVTSLGKKPELRKTTVFLKVGNKAYKETTGKPHRIKSHKYPKPRGRNSTSHATRVKHARKNRMKRDSPFQSYQSMRQSPF